MRPVLDATRRSNTRQLGSLIGSTFRSAPPSTPSRPVHVALVLIIVIIVFFGHAIITTTAGRVTHDGTVRQILVGWLEVCS